MLNLGIHLINHIQEVHQAGLTHGDIKADNITIGNFENQVDHKGLARFIDFGASTRYKNDKNEHISQKL